MANVKISNLPVAATVDGASSVPVVEGGVTKQVTFTGMLTSPALFASGMAAFFATPSSANLRAALTDETGTGAAVFADSPTLTGAVSVTGTVAATKLIPTGNVTAGNGMYLPATNTLAWSTNGAEGMRLDASGNVGIGTSSPFNSSVSNVRAGDVRYVLGDTSQAADKRYWDQISTGGVLYFRSVADSDANSTSFMTAERGTGVASNWIVSAVTLNTNGAEGMRLDASGNLLVGTTSSAGRICSDVGSSTTRNAYDGLTPNSYAGIVYQSRSLTAAGNGWYHFVGQSGNGSSITTNNILIFGNGDVQNTNNSYGAISDRKLKENITDASPKLNDLLQVRIVNYNFKTQPDQRCIGVIAQELEQVFPGMVSETPDRDADGNDLGTTTKGVKYSVFVPMLIKAIQEQQAIINDLRARVAALEA